MSADAPSEITAAQAEVMIIEKCVHARLTQRLTRQGLPGRRGQVGPSTGNVRELIVQINALRSALAKNELELHKQRVTLNQSVFASAWSITRPP